MFSPAPLLIALTAARAPAAVYAGCTVRRHYRNRELAMGKEARKRRLPVATGETEQEKVKSVGPFLRRRRRCCRLKRKRGEGANAGCLSPLLTKGEGKGEVRTPAAGRLSPLLRRGGGTCRHYSQRGRGRAKAGRESPLEKQPNQLVVGAREFQYLEIQ